MNLSRGAVLLPAILIVMSLAVACGGGSAPEGWATPVLGGDSAYVFTSKNKLAALTVGATSSQRWHFPNDDLKAQKDIDLRAVYDAPLRTDTALYLATYKGELYALNPADGAILWKKTDLHGGVIAGPVLAQDKYLVFGTIEERLFVLDAASGQPATMESGYRWPENGIKTPGAVWAAPAIRGGSIIIATMTGNVVAYNIQGGSPRQLYHSAGAVPDLALLDDDHLFVPSLNKTVTILNPETGAVLSTYRAAHWVWTRPAYQSGIAYFGDFSGEVVALDITTGLAKWTFATGSRIKAAPALVGGVLVIADRSPNVHFFDTASGKRLNTVPVASAGTIRAGAATAANQVYFVTTKGRLFRANPADLSVSELVITGARP